MAVLILGHDGAPICHESWERRKNILFMLFAKDVKSTEIYRPLLFAFFKSCTANAFPLIVFGK
jgi:hypothetical protein